MTLQPKIVGFLVQRAEMLVGADLFRVVRADRRVAGAAPLLFDLPVTEQIGGAAAGAELLFPSPHPADDSA